MKSEDIRKLLGGYAAGILTEEERKALFEVALADQDLFNELAGEQALKELLDDDRARRQLLHALGEKEPLAQRFRGWLGRPLSWAMAGGLAAAVLLVAVFVRTGTPPSKMEQPLIARREAAPKPELERREPPAQAVPARQALQKAKALPSAPPPMAVGKVELADAKEELRPRLAKSEPLANAPMAAALEKDKTLRMDFAVQPAPLRYRVLRRDAGGDYAEVDAQTVFQNSDLIRVSFETSESGRLRVTSVGAGGSSEVVFNNSVRKGANYDLDVPPGELKLVAVFSSPASPAAAPIEIPIRRQP